MSAESQATKSAESTTGKKPNFFQKLFVKLDQKMKDKADASESCCCDQKDGSKKESEKCC